MERNQAEVLLAHKLALLQNQLAIKNILRSDPGVPPGSEEKAPLERFDDLLARAKRVTGAGQTLGGWTLRLVAREPAENSPYRPTISAFWEVEHDEAIEAELGPGSFKTTIAEQVSRSFFDGSSGYYAGETQEAQEKRDEALRKLNRLEHSVLAYEAEANKTQVG